MTIKFQGAWEPERIATVLESLPEFENIKSWGTDCAKRIRQQIEAKRLKNDVMFRSGTKKEHLQQGG